MHGGGAKRVRFKKNQTRVKFKICFKFGLKIKKISHYQSWSHSLSHHTHSHQIWFLLTMHATVHLHNASIDSSPVAIARLDA
jgi:hypothetical protein